VTKTGNGDEQTTAFDDGNQPSVPGKSTPRCLPAGKPTFEHTKAAEGVRLSMLVLHDDAKRVYACGPAHGLPNTKAGAFRPALCDQATKQGRIVISMHGN